MIWRDVGILRIRTLKILIKEEKMNIQKDLIQIRFSAYLNAAVRNERIRYITKKNKCEKLQIADIELQTEIGISFDEQYHKYKKEKTDYIYEDWKKYRQFMKLMDEKELKEAMGCVGEYGKMLIFARLFGDLSFQEIGNMFLLNEKQAQMAYYYALRKIRKELEKKNEF